jgi:hypothetical protein
MSLEAQLRTLTSTTLEGANRIADILHTTCTVLPQNDINVFIDGDLWLYRFAAGYQTLTPSGTVATINHVGIRDKIELSIDDVVQTAIDIHTGSIGMSLFDSGINVIIVFSSKTNYKNNFEAFEPYKGNRKPFPYNKDVVKKAIDDYVSEGGRPGVNLVVCDLEDHETDDTISILIEKKTAHIIDNKPIIVTTDKDFNQIPRVVIYNDQKGSRHEYTNEECCEMLATQFLVGDTSDNIPGLKGIGPVKAGKLLSTVDWSALPYCLINRSVNYFDFYINYQDNHHKTAFTIGELDSFAI